MFGYPVKKWKYLHTFDEETKRFLVSIGYELYDITQYPKKYYLKCQIN